MNRFRYRFPSASQICAMVSGRALRLSALALWAAVGSSLSVSSVSAQETQTTQSPAAEVRSPFSIGFQSSFPAHGLSVLYQMSDQISAQGVVSRWGSVTVLTGRGIFRHYEQNAMSLYSAGSASLWSAGGSSILTFGVGGGVELDWQKLLAQKDEASLIPRLSTSLELGLEMLGDDLGGLSFLRWGFGVHYRL